MRQVIEKGYISNKYLKEFDNEYGKTYSTQIIASQYMGKGNGYNGTDYKNIWINVNISGKLTNNLPPQDGLYVLVIGQLRQDEKKDNGFTTKISVQEIYHISKLNYGINTPLENNIEPLNNNSEEIHKIANDSILWED